MKVKEWEKGKGGREKEGRNWKERKGAEPW